jgi:hypothetical protein
MGCSAAAAAQVQVSSKNSLVLSFTFYLVIFFLILDFEIKSLTGFLLATTQANNSQRRESRDEQI